PIPTGGSAPEPSMVLAAVVQDTNAAATLRLEVEVQPVGTAFQDQTTAVSDPAVAGTRAFVWVGGLQDNTGYHWQARVVDATAASAWVAYGGNAENAADVRVALPVAVNHLEFTQPPSTTTAGETMAPVDVTLKDGQGKVITSFTVGGAAGCQRQGRCGDVLQLDDDQGGERIPARGDGGWRHPGHQRLVRR
ncbi:MAG: hypothetical protein DMD25_15905, partial [Gemmatimonadetes bacterium]